MDTAGASPWKLKHLVDQVCFLVNTSENKENKKERKEMLISVFINILMPNITYVIFWYFLLFLMICKD